jgi:predicted permease
MESFLQDIRFAARQFLRSRATAIVAIVTLALGIGANTSMFTLLNAVLFRKPHVAAPDGLEWISSVEGRGRQFRNMSYPDFADMRARATSFSGIAAYAHSWLSLGGAKPERVRGEIVTANYFDVLGVRAELGRTFRPDEDAVPGANAVAVLSDDAWHTRFDSDPAILGKQIVINGRGFTVIGVAPPSFTGVEINDDAPQAIWLPVSMVAVAEPGMGDVLTNRLIGGWLRAFGRLSPHATPASANAALAVIASQLHPASDKSVENFGLTSFALVGGVDPSNQAEIGPVITLLMLVPLLVLVVACANAANVMLARGLARRKELAVRRAIGASRWRLVRQLLTESVLLTLIAAVLGVTLSFWMTALIGRLGEIPAGVLAALSPDAPVLLATTALAVAAGLLFGLAPALAASRSALTPDLKSEGATIRLGRQRHRLRDVFMVGQMAVSLLLLVTAGLFGRSLAKAIAVDPGYGARSGVYLSFDLARQNYPDDRQAAFVRDLSAKVAALPGVQSVALSNAVPFGGSFNGGDARIEDAPTDGRGIGYLFSAVTPTYFDALQVPVVRGRGFSARDDAGSPPVVIINETFARKLWPGEDAIGKRVRLVSANGALREVVGIVRDGKYASLTEAPRAYAWMPLAQNPAAELTLVVRTSADAAAAALPVTRVVQSLDPDLPVFNVKTFANALHGAADMQQAASSMLAVFGVLALALAALGMFSVTAHAVALRTREIGIRMSLGARSANVMSMFVREGLARSAIGAGIGLALSAALSKVLAQYLFGLGATDAITFVGGAGVLCLVAVVASYIPSRRAARIDPVVALRAE